MNKTFIRLSNNGAAYWLKKTKEELSFNKSLLKTVKNHLTENCYFKVRMPKGSRQLAYHYELNLHHLGKIFFHIPMRKNTCHH